MTLDGTREMFNDKMKYQRIFEVFDFCATARSPLFIGQSKHVI